ncbi:hypothetical protein E0W68_09550 [Flavobacterium salilacus subsp. salilacus]|uniref:hypothetical protein n=1 Tax=Flavobacterium TaxID=237 RepID=UPI0010757B1B|nr:MULTISPECIES: hypothetical protein [Flavobacterium]KAF2518259.1 hypothetical protein E0W68_09550 [Flavobacterium salilacus subsp. salilacus]MBE1615331.1 hypothetical protein [Flavobacterium sp. SaA2.13]
MIQEIKNRPPYIHITDLKISFPVGENITVWLSGQYNEAEYNYSLTAIGAATNEKVSNYEYSLTYDTPGTYTLFAVLTGKGATKGKELTSNILTLTVV